MVVPDASRSRHVAFLKQSSGFSTQVRNGICCRKAIPTTKRYIGAFRLGAALEDAAIVSAAIFASIVLRPMSVRRFE